MAPQVYDRFVHYHGLHNLLWVYGPSSQFPMGSDDEGGYPGLDTVDILGQDLYANEQGDGRYGYATADYEELVRVAQEKIVGWTEIGLAPGSSVMTAQKHAYFLMWGGFELHQPWGPNNTNTREQLRALYWDPRTITQGGLDRL